MTTKPASVIPDALRHEMPLRWSGISSNQQIPHLHRIISCCDACGVTVT